MSPKEIWQEGSKVVVDYYNERITITSIGNFDKGRALRCKEFIFRIFEESATPFDLVIDLTYEGRQGRGVRKIWKEINAHPKVRYVALCGINRFSKVIHTIIIGFKKHPRLRLFTNKEAGHGWITDLIVDLRTWFNANRNELPLEREEILMSVNGENYIGRYQPSRKLFKVEGELMETSFSTGNHQIYWKYYQKQHFRENLTATF
jgi:hypothetical protein